MITSMNNKSKLHPDLLLAQELFYEPNGLICKNIIQETESQQYGACSFIINNKKIIFRVAKITPTKIGQFVTFWKRLETNGPIAPYDMTDQFDFLIVSVKYNNKMGQFVFSKSVLLEQEIISHNNKGGKRAIRVYPPWEKPTSKQALKTQSWQLDCYLLIEQTNKSSRDLINKLFI